MCFHLCYEVICLSFSVCVSFFSTLGHVTRREEMHSVPSHNPRNCLTTIHGENFLCKLWLDLSLFWTQTFFLNSGWFSLHVSFVLFANDKKDNQSSNPVFTTPFCWKITASNCQFVCSLVNSKIRIRASTHITPFYFLLSATTITLAWYLFIKLQLTSKTFNWQKWDSGRGRDKRQRI